MRLGLAYHGFGVEGLRFWVLRAGACVQCTLPVQDNPQGLGMRDGGVGLVLRFVWGKQADGRIFSCNYVGFHHRRCRMILVILEYKRSLAYLLRGTG